MVNPIKIAKVISKATKARDAASKKSYSAAPGAERGKKSSRTSPLPTAGKTKAVKRAKESDISVGLVGSKKNGKLAFKVPVKKRGN